MNNENRILVVILHYGDERYTWGCIESIASYGGLDLLIVDNDPSQSLEIESKYKSICKLFKTGGAAGFAEANNMGVEYARREYHHSILLLNNDTVVLQDAIPRLACALMEDDVGVVGPCMPYSSNINKIWSCGGAISKLRIRAGGITAFEGGEPFEVDYLPGAAILCKIHIWDLVKGLPEKYFLAYEEVEFAMRINKIGYKVMAVPAARIIHHVGMSSIMSPMYIYNSIRNRIRFGQYLYGVHIGFFYAVLITLREASKAKHGIKLWKKAIASELKGEPLDRRSLQEIHKIFN